VDNFLRLTDEKKKGQGRKVKAPFSPNISDERIEKVKKSFQPFWMRGMIPHSRDGDETLKGMNNFDQA
jgi:hypothetical protein